MKNLVPALPRACRAAAARLFRFSGVSVFLHICPGYVFCPASFFRFCPVSFFGCTSLRRICFSSETSFLVPFFSLHASGRMLFSNDLSANVSKSCESPGKTREVFARSVRSGALSEQIILLCRRVMYKTSLSLLPVETGNLETGNYDKSYFL